MVDEFSIVLIPDVTVDYCKLDIQKMTKIISDEPRSKPSIDPLEKPNKEDELDALLKLNAPKRTTTSSQPKKSNPIVYNFTEPIENLHLGLSSSGKDFSRTTTTKKGPEH